MKQILGRGVPLLVAVVLAGFTGCDSRPPVGKSPEAIRQKAQECADAMLQGDYGKMADLTHPKIVKMMGGRDRIVATIQSGMEQMKAQKISIVSYKVEAPAEVVGSGSDHAAVVPATLEMKGPGMKLKQKSYLLAISSDDGKSWSFVDGSDLDDEKVKLILPNPPSGLKLPPKQPPQIDQG
jgi:hypothetical protein